MEEDVSRNRSGPIHVMLRLPLLIILTGTTTINNGVYGQIYEKLPAFLK
ncbi:hypothetical protein Y032_0285g1345, partial [Ancylostoma ceylanicum]